MNRRGKYQHIMGPVANTRNPNTGSGMGWIQWILYSNSNTFSLPSYSWTFFLPSIHKQLLKPQTFFLHQSSAPQIYTNLSIFTLLKHIIASWNWPLPRHLPLQNSRRHHSWLTSLSMHYCLVLLLTSNKQTLASPFMIYWSPITIYSHQYLPQLLNLFHYLGSYPSKFLT